MPDDYAARLASGSTTFCRCFRLTRLDGTVLGFTDHDEDVDLDGLVCRARAALDASELAASLGMAPDELDAQGALDDEALREIDLAAGLYDGATVELFDVDWTDPGVRRLLGWFTVGQVERGPLAFRAELRSLAASLTRKEGRVHSYLCDVRLLGDARCKVDIEAGGWIASGAIVSAEGAELVVAGLGKPSGFFDGGRVTFTSGVNAGRGFDVRVSRLRGDGTFRVSLWREPFAEPSPGDALEAVAGCDRTAATCRAKFGNIVNFRGFPHMPGEGTEAEYASTGDPNLDGGSRFG